MILIRNGLNFFQKFAKSNRSFKKLFANRCDKICTLSSLENDYVNDKLFMRINIAAIL